jgi:uncharacterized protein
MGSRTFLFRAILPIFGFAIFVYLSNQLLRFTGLTFLQTLPILLWILTIVAGIISLPLLFWLDDNRGEKDWHLPFHSFAHLCIGYFSYLLFLVMGRDVLAFICSIFRYYPLPYDLKEATVMLVLPFIFMFLGWLNVRIGPYIHTVRIPYKNLPEEFDGLKILQISDLHIGPGVTKKKIQSIVEKTNEQNPDIIVLTGDIIDYHADRFAEEIHCLSGLKAKYGVYYIMGNHEYFWNYQNTKKAVEKLPSILLLNQTQKINIGDKVLSITGATDPIAQYFGLTPPDYDILDKQAVGADFKIILCHQPNQVEKVRTLSFDLQLSGHTHSGQFIPWSLMIRLFQKYPRGVYNLGKIKLFVCQGTGFWGPPDRFGTYSEISEIFLTKA